jgi:hypothetical protein
VTLSPAARARLLAMKKSGGSCWTRTIEPELTRLGLVVALVRHSGHEVHWRLTPRGELEAEKLTSDEPPI